MGQEPPEFCPYCGTSLTPVDPPGLHRCDSCDDWVSHYPAPCARLAILDGNALLLVKVDRPGRVLWGTPGGMVEPGEDPDVAGARELREETTLTVDPDDLVLFDVRTFPKFGSFHKTSLCYAVDAGDVSETPRAADEVAAANWWTKPEFAASNGQLLTSWPSDDKEFQWWVEEARTALAKNSPEE